MTSKHSKTKTSYYRRLYVAHLIDSGINTVPLLLETTVLSHLAYFTVFRFFNLLIIFFLNF
ncbi:MAG: helix-turn-helix domain-containing protein, partial [Alteromonadaceae bacterium]|nr:helix-turn-helix domain-containing protein [Alteromonadaceae bacterium]